MTPLQDNYPCCCCCCCCCCPHLAATMYALSMPGIAEATLVAISSCTHTVTQHKCADSQTVGHEHSTGYKTGGPAACTCTILGLSQQPLYSTVQYSNCRRGTPTSALASEPSAHEGARRPVAYPRHTMSGSVPPIPTPAACRPLIEAVGGGGQQCHLKEIALAISQTSSQDVVAACQMLGQVSHR